MEPQDFERALAELGWKQSDFCRKAGVERSTPSRWLSGKAPIPLWASAYLEAIIDIQRLHAKYVSVNGMRAADVRATLSQEADVKIRRAMDTWNAMSEEVRAAVLKAASTAEPAQAMRYLGHDIPERLEK